MVRRTICLNEYYGKHAIHLVKDPYAISIFKHTILHAIDGTGMNVRIHLHLYMRYP